jgi:3-methyladenine DNA glycosylase AlkD
MVIHFENSSHKLTQTSAFWYYLTMQAQTDLRSYADPAHAILLQRFFKTGPGEYGQGDVFLGVRVPQTRKVAKNYQNLALGDIKHLLTSSIHEERLLALIIMTLQYPKTTTTEQEELYKTYLSYRHRINNWDLVDSSAEHILGAHLYGRSRSMLFELAGSEVLWDRRIAIMATFYFIRRNDYSTTLEVATQLLNDPHDLIHKAVGWMLREIGNRDQLKEEQFLLNHYREMPRTMLRYAIEKFPHDLRQNYLKGLI